MQSAVLIALGKLWSSRRNWDQVTGTATRLRTDSHFKDERRAFASLLPDVVYASEDCSTVGKIRTKRCRY